MLGDRRVAGVLFARAAAREPNDYRAWLALAAVTRGDVAEAAVLRARGLNPHAVRAVPGVARHGVAGIGIHTRGEEEP